MSPDSCPYCGALLKAGHHYWMQWGCGSEASRRHQRDPVDVIQSPECARYVRMRISQLRRMAHTAWLRAAHHQLALANGRKPRYDRFASACLREIDRLRAELDAAHDGEDALRSEVARLRAQVAALQSVPQGVEVPELTAAVVEELHQKSKGHRNPGYALAFEMHRWVKEHARLIPAAPQPLHPEERRVGADEVVVSREEWEVIEQILKASAICANEGGTDRYCCMQTDDHYIPLTRIRAIRSLRTSAQAPGKRGEG